MDGMVLPENGIDLGDLCPFRFYCLFKIPSEKGEHINAASILHTFSQIALFHPCLHAYIDDGRPRRRLYFRRGGGRRRGSDI